MLPLKGLPFAVVWDRVLEEVCCGGSEGLICCSDREFSVSTFQEWPGLVEFGKDEGLLGGRNDGGFRTSFSWITILGALTRTDMVSFRRPV